MGRQRRGSSGPSSSRPVDPEIVEELEMEEQREASDSPPMVRQRSRRRTRQELDDAETEKWVRGIERRRGYTCERQVRMETFSAEYPGISAILAQGLHFFFRPLVGYNKKAVTEFYKNMVIVDDHPTDPLLGSITSRIGRVEVVVTVDIIATYMGYHPPHPFTVNYPRTMPIATDTLVSALYVNPRDFRGNFTPGHYKEQYRLINKILCHNLYPRASEWKPSKKSAELTYAFGQPGTICNWAKFIYGQLLDFRYDVPQSANFIFPCMITALCREAGVRGIDQNETLVPGPLDSHQMGKSRAQSKPTARRSEARESLTTRPPPNSGVVAWFEKLFCMSVSNVKNIRKIKLKQKEIKMKQKEMDAKLDWQNERIRRDTGEEYVPAPVVLSDDSDDDDDDDGGDERGEPSQPVQEETQVPYARQYDPEAWPQWEQGRHSYYGGSSQQGEYGAGSQWEQPSRHSFHGDYY